MTTTYTDYKWFSSNARVSTSTVQSVDSDKKPLMNITCNGVLLPTNKRTYVLELSFTGPSYPEKDLGGQSYGTFCIGEKVLNAVKIIKTAWDKEKKTLVINIDLKTTYKIINLRKPTLFSFSIQINDFEIFIPPLTSPIPF